MPTGIYVRTVWHRAISAETLRKTMEKRRLLGIKSVGMTGKTLTVEQRGKRSLVLKRAFLEGRNSGCFKKGVVPWNKGKEVPQLQGERCHFWRGGINGAKKKEQRNDPGYKAWVLACKRRDSYICFDCGEVKKGEMEVNHILPWALYPRLRYDINNGETLCRECHLVKTINQLKGRRLLINNT